MIVALALIAAAASSMALLSLRWQAESPLPEQWWKGAAGPAHFPGATPMAAELGPRENTLDRPARRR